MQDKKTLISIIVLLVIFLPLAIYGTVMRGKKEEIVIDDNPNKDYIYNNKVYFYNNGTLLTTYDCEGICSEVTPQIDDKQYNINYYRTGKSAVPTVLNNGFALFKENDLTILYNTALETKLLQFDLIKTYNVEHSHPVLIIKSNGMYGVLSLDEMTPIINYKYDFIGIPNRVNDGILDTSKFIAKSGSYWYILNSEGQHEHEAFREPIVDFNNTYAIVYNLGIYKIYDYNMVEYLTDINKKAAYCIGENVIVIDNENVLNIYTDVNGTSLRTITLPTYTDIDFELVGNKIDIYIDGTSYQSIVLS